jgi:hypothetical protein
MSDTIQGQEAQSGTAPSAPRERGWKGVVFALILMLAVPALGPLRLAVPIEQLLVLLVPAIAVCMLLGWWEGGRLSLAIVWTVVAGWMLAQPVGIDPVYGSLARGWALLLATSFGIVSLAAPRLSLFPRALASVSIALAAGIVMLLITSTTGDRLQELLVGQYARRVDQSLAFMQLPDWQEVVSRRPDMQPVMESMAAQFREWPSPAALLSPAFLALESIAVLAVAWALYHRLSRVRLGPPLSAFRDFRFSDQLVWGIIVGLVATIFPSLADLRTFGLNLLVFFGVLYVLRGLGVLSFLAPGRATTVMLVFAAFFIPVWPFIGAFALGLGLGDTWLDWRSRARPTSQ